MRPPHTATLVLAASLLAGCAGTSHWTSPAAAKLPRSLNLHVDPFRVHNPKDLQKDLQIDSAGFQAWIAPRLAIQLQQECGLDTVILLDSVPSRIDSGIKLDDWNLKLSRPTGTPPAGWTLMISSGAAFRYHGSGTGMNNISLSWFDLVVGTHYLLIDGSTGLDLAYGAAYGRTTAPVWDPEKEGMKSSSWEKSTAKIPETICKDIGHSTGRRSTGTSSKFGR